MLRLGSLRCWRFFLPRKCDAVCYPIPPPPPPQLIVLQMGEGGWRVVYSTRTASRVHVLFFLVYTYCLRLCTAALCTQLFIHNDPSSQLFTQLSGIPFTDFKQSGSWALWQSVCEVRWWKLRTVVCFQVWIDPAEEPGGHSEKEESFHYTIFYQILRLKLIGVETILCYSYRCARTRCKASGVMAYGQRIVPIRRWLSSFDIVKVVYRPNQFLLICLYLRLFSNFIYYLPFAYAKQVLWFVYIYILNWSCFLCKTGLAHCLDIICDGSV